jgi:LEA14-like dessication related protein
MAIDPKKKKYIIAAAAIGLVAIAGTFAYLQYQRIMDYVIKIKTLKFKKISLTSLNFDLFLNFENKSDLRFTIEKQIYDVYLNNVFISRVENSSPTVINPKSINVIGLNVSVNPKDAFNKLKKNALNLLTTPDKMIIKVVCKLRVKLFIFSINIPYTYEDNIKSIMTPTPVEQ